MDLATDPTDKIFNYIALLEETNGRLLNSLEKTVRLLAQFKQAVPDPEGWQDMLDQFNQVIALGQRIAPNKTQH